MPGLLFATSFRPVGKTLGQPVNIKAGHLGAEFSEQVKIRQIDCQKTNGAAIHWPEGGARCGVHFGTEAIL